MKINHQYKTQFRQNKLVVKGEFVSIVKLQHDKFGYMIAISKKFGNAVQRNYIKRHIRTVLCKDILLIGLYKITLIARYTKYVQLVNDVNKVLEKLNE